MNSSNWDNLRFVLRVAETGSVSGAARQLGVTHATVLRRIAAFEEDHGGPVFEKTANGTRIMPERMRVIDAARDVAHAMETVDRIAQGTGAPMHGLVRISSTDSLCVHVLPGLVQYLQSTAPELQVEVISTNLHLDLGRMQSDIILRAGTRLSEDLRGIKVGEIRFQAFARDLQEVRWLGMSGAIARSIAADWMAEHVSPEHVVVRADSFLVLRALAEQGMGAALLPEIVVDESHQLNVLGNQSTGLSVPIWIASHPETYDSPRIRTVRQNAASYLSRFLAGSD